MAKTMNFSDNGRTCNKEDLTIEEIKEFQKELSLLAISAMQKEAQKEKDVQKALSKVTPSQRSPGPMYIKF